MECFPGICKALGLMPRSTDRQLDSDTCCNLGIQEVETDMRPCFSNTLRIILSLVKVMDCTTILGSRDLTSKESAFKASLANYFKSALNVVTHIAQGFCGRTDQFVLPTAFYQGSVSSLSLDANLMPP